MSILQAILLGAVQGLTEFLPVSSSGHLIIVRYFMKIGTIPVLFDVVLHLATLVVVMWTFRRRIANLLSAGGRSIIRRPLIDDGPQIKLWGLLIAATGITAVLGMVIMNLNIRDDPRLVAMLMIVTALILLASSLAKGSIQLISAGWKRALIIGTAQGMGVLPGISRSGISISTGLFLGMDRNAAGEFSFLLSIPAILGAFVLSVKDAGALSDSVSLLALLGGFATALITGYACLKMLLWLVASGRLWIFAIYLLPLGVWILIF